MLKIKQRKKERGRKEEREGKRERGNLRLIRLPNSLGIQRP